MTKLFIGRVTNFNRANYNFEILHILSLLNKLKDNGVRGRKRFGFLLKSIPTSTGFERISHSLVQKIFSFENLNFQKWVVKSPFLRLYISPFLEKCLMSSPPELLCGYSLPLLRLGIKSDLFKSRLTSAVTDYGPIFPTKHVMHSICYLHWNRLPTSETVIMLANLIDDFDEIVDMEDEEFSVGNLVMWLSELDIRHDPLLEKLADYMLSPQDSVITNVSRGREYIRALLIARGEVEMERDALVSFRQRWPEESNVSVKQLGNLYYWHRGRFRPKPLLSLGMDKLSSEDLCKIVLYGKFETTDIMEAIAYDYSYSTLSSEGHHRNFDTVDADLYARFLLALSKGIKLLPKVADALLNTGIKKFARTTTKGKSAIIEALFNMGPSAWSAATLLVQSDLTTLDLKSLSYIHLMATIPPPAPQIYSILLSRLHSMSFSGLLLKPRSKFQITAPDGFRTQALFPSPVPVYDRSTFHNYKWDKAKPYQKKPEIPESTLQASHINRMDESDTESLSTSRTALLALTTSTLLGGHTISPELLNIANKLHKYIRYISTPYSKIDQSYTLWTSSPADEYKRKLRSQLIKGERENMDPRYTAIHPDLIEHTHTERGKRNERSQSNKAMDKPFGVQKSLEYFEEYLHRMSRKGVLLHETYSKEHTTTSSMEDNIYQTLLSIYPRDKLHRQTNAALFTIDFVIPQQTKQ